MRKIWIQVFHTSGARIFALAVSVIGLSITARYLGPDGRGIIAAAQSWVLTFATLGSLSLSQVVLYVATGRNRQEWLPNTLGTLLLVTVVMTLLGSGIMCCAYLATDGSAFNNLSIPVIAVVFFGLPFLIFNEYGNAILTAVDRLRIMNRIQIASATVNVVLIYVAIVKLGLGVMGALAITVIVQLTSSSLIFYDVFRLEKKVEINWPEARKMVMNGLKLHMNAIGSFLFTSVNVLIVNHFRSSTETGYYQLSAQLITVAQIVPLSVSNVVYTIISKKGPNAAWPENKKLLYQSLLLTATFVIVAYFISPLAITIVAGKDFFPSVSLFRILLLSLFGLAVYTIMFGQWVGRGLFLQASLLTLAVGLINTISILIFVPEYGISAAAWSTVLIYSILGIANAGMAFWINKKYLLSRRSL